MPASLAHPRTDFAKNQVWKRKKSQELATETGGKTLAIAQIRRSASRTPRLFNCNHSSSNATGWHAASALSWNPGPHAPLTALFARMISSQETKQTKKQGVLPAGSTTTIMWTWTSTAAAAGAPQEHLAFKERAQLRYAVISPPQITAARSIDAVLESHPNLSGTICCTNVVGNTFCSAGVSSCKPVDHSLKQGIHVSVWNTFWKRKAKVPCLNHCSTTAVSAAIQLALLNISCKSEACTRTCDWLPAALEGRAGSGGTGEAAASDPQCVWFFATCWTMPLSRSSCKHMNMEFTANLPPSWPLLHPRLSWSCACV